MRKGAMRKLVSGQRSPNSIIRTEYASSQVTSHVSSDWKALPFLRTLTDEKLAQQRTEAERKRCAKPQASAIPTGEPSFLVHFGRNQLHISVFLIPQTYG